MNSTETVMNHYISPTNGIYGYETTQASLIPEDYVIIPDTYSPDVYSFLTLVDGEIHFNEAASTLELSNDALAENTIAIQNQLDRIAQSRGYTDIKSACAYASSVAYSGSDAMSLLQEKFRIEGNALQSWMSLTWATAFTYMATVTAGTNPMPTVLQTLALMPTFTWPD